MNKIKINNLADTKFIALVKFKDALIGIKGL